MHVRNTKFKLEWRTNLFFFARKSLMNLSEELKCTSQIQLNLSIMNEMMIMMMIYVAYTCLEWQYCHLYCS